MKAQGVMVAPDCLQTPIDPCGLMKPLEQLKIIARRNRFSLRYTSLKAIACTFNYAWQWLVDMYQKLTNT